MGESIKRIVGPYQDSYSPNGIIGEKDACGVGFIANIKGVESNWILKQSLIGLNCMEHRGGCGGAVFAWLLVGTLRLDSIMPIIKNIWTAG